MRRKYIIVLLSCFALAVFSGCDDPQKQFQLLIDLDMSRVSQSDFWLVVTDHHGNVIGHEMWLGEDHLTINGEVYEGKKINVLLVDQYGGTVKVRAFTNVSPGRQWIFEIPSGPVSVGQMHLDLKNMPFNNHHAITGTYGANPFFLQGNCNQREDVMDCSYFFNVSTTPATLVLCDVPGDSSPKIFSVDTLKSGNSYEYDFKEVFTLYDHEVNIPTQLADGVECVISGIDQNDNVHPLCKFHGERFGDFITMGYNDEFSKYQTEFEWYDDTRDFWWTVIGSSVTADHFKFPELPFTIVDKRFDTFEYNVNWNKPVEYQCSRWVGGIPDGTSVRTIDFIVYGNRSKGMKVIDKFPEEIIAIIPDLSDLSILGYRWSDFVFSEGDVSYEQSIDEQFSDLKPTRRSKYDMLVFDH